MLRWKTTFGGRRVCRWVLGVKGACDVALPVSLSSLQSARDLVQAILSDFNKAESGDLAAAEECYVGRWPGLAAPTDVCSQKDWDMPCALDVKRRPHGQTLLQTRTQTLVNQFVKPCPNARHLRSLYFTANLKMKRLFVEDGCQ